MSTGPRIPLIRPSYLVWIPIAATLTWAAETQGLPHILWIETHEPPGGAHHCRYLGLHGEFPVRARAPRCPVIHLITHGEARKWRP